MSQETLSTARAQDSTQTDRICFQRDGDLVTDDDKMA